MHNRPLSHSAVSGPFPRTVLLVDFLTISFFGVFFWACLPRAIRLTVDLESPPSTLAAIAAQLGRSPFLAKRAI